MPRTIAGLETRKGRPPRLRQVGALPYRLADDRLEILLVTSRGTARPILPKGWPMKGLSDRRAAETEAREEAGVVGRPWKKPLGTYDYWKRLRDGFVMTEVEVFPIAVVDMLDDYRERGQRRLLWLPSDQASQAVHEPALAKLLDRFVERMLQDDPAPVRR